MLLDISLKKKKSHIHATSFLCQWALGLRLVLLAPGPDQFHSRKAQHQAVHAPGYLGPQMGPQMRPPGHPAVTWSLGGSGPARLSSSPGQTLTLGRFHLTAGPGVPL